MAPWKLPELEECRSGIGDFGVISEDFLKELYRLIGGVPRYVLEKPKNVLSLAPNNLTRAMKNAYERVQHALDNIRDPLKLMQRGECTFRFKDLQDNSETTFNIPPNPPVEFFDNINDVTPGSLYFPRITNFACVDALLAPNHLLQITVSERHPIKGEPFKKLLGSLVKNHWIRTSEDAQLIFIVPQDIYGDFKKQSYLKGKAVDTDVPEVLKDVKQYVLGVGLRAASTGGSPGMTREAIEALRSNTALESL
ncbi:hypothetical protein BGX21_004720 [Mortierella sp. AD011]|nr:hypothetical protein BGX20_004758 [Mortierella sp. AD010]KAF9372637.1 hypothetical protein BGX21_004720 [Mortierella sp. AD011]